jgi:ferredoxin
VSQEDLQAIVGLAIVDREFCATLLACPRAAVEGFQLSDEELATVASIRAESVEQFAARLELWLSKLPLKRRRQFPASSPGDLRVVAG